MIANFAAGQFYEADFENLDKQIKQCFLDKKGPGDLPGKRTDKKVFGVIAPHAGFFFSGSCQAWAYKAIAEARFPKRFLILAPDHNGLHSSITTCYEDWETPFGAVRTDKDFIEKLLDKCKEVKKSPTLSEHAIEVQLPFLQFVNRDKIKDILIVPLIVPKTENLQEVAECITEIDNDICVIISSDFTHYGPTYSFTPFGDRFKEKMKQLDSGAIEAVKSLKSEDFLEYIKRTEATICGEYAIALGIEIVKELFAKKAHLLQYYTSSDVVDDKNTSVGYAAISFD